MVASQVECLEDHDLALRLVDGDVRAFEVIYARYRAQAYRVALAITGRRCAAEEATQDAFLTLWRKAHSYDPARGQLSSLLLAIVRNRSIDWVRRETRHDRSLGHDDATAERIEAPDRTDDQALDRAEARDACALVRLLPREQRKVVELTFINGLSQSEIATEIGVPLGTVKGRQRLALGKLHRSLIGAAVGRETFA